MLPVKRVQPKLEKNYSVHLNLLAHHMLVIEQEVAALVDLDSNLFHIGQWVKDYEVIALELKVERYLLGAHWLLRGLKAQHAAPHTRSWASRQVEGLIDYQRVLGDLKRKEGSDSEEQS